MKRNPTYSLEKFIDMLADGAEMACAEEDEEIRLTKLQLLNLCAKVIDNMDLLDCIWCGVNTGEVGEYYVVDNALWAQYGPPYGCLCIGCLEDRMGRQLQPNDFSDVPANHPQFSPKSDRLRQRLGLMTNA